MPFETPQRPDTVLSDRLAVETVAHSAAAPATNEVTAVRAAVRRALEVPPPVDPAQSAAEERAALADLYRAVAARVVLLRADGLRPERVLVALKREAFAVMDEMALAATPADGRRADDVMRHIVRWCVEAYHRGD